MTPCAAATCTRELRDNELAAHQTLCTPCVDTIRTWLLELPTQIIVLEGSRQRETTGSRTGGRTVHRTAPLPGRADTLNLLGPAAWCDGVRDPYGDSTDDQHGALPIAGVLIPWVRLITEERRWNPPLVLTPQALAEWLAAPRPLAWASRQPWGGDMRDELHQLMRTVRDVTNVRPRRRAITQPCPRCDSLTLVETDHQLYIDCTHPDCQSIFTRAELAFAASIHPEALKANAA
ncbi:hypothetical protein AB0F46_35255 [Streptomyces sp. NPDC026665]|uniref:hypothetical protein n=1 Tax=Streptomyces sp. NPDC026665 TaxID=3154798 RepID=UPI003407F5AC